MEKDLSGKRLTPPVAWLHL